MYSAIFLYSVKASVASGANSSLSTELKRRAFLIISVVPAILLAFGLAIFHAQAYLLNDIEAQEATRLGSKGQQRGR